MGHCRWGSSSRKQGGCRAGRPPTDLRACCANPELQIILHPKGDPSYTTVWWQSRWGGGAIAWSKRGARVHCSCLTLSTAHPLRAKVVPLELTEAKREDLLHHLSCARETGYLNLTFHQWPELPPEVGPDLQCGCGKASAR